MQNGLARKLLTHHNIRRTPRRLCYHRRVSRRKKVHSAYSQIEFRPHSLGFWAQITRVPPECIHLERDFTFAATLVPDTAYHRGKPFPQTEHPRPLVSLCRECLVRVIQPELAHYSGKVVAFEPDAPTLTQYFFVERNDFEAAGLLPDVADAIARRLDRLSGSCEECSSPARWLWLSRADVANLDDFGSIANFPGRSLCAQHGARQLCAAIENIREANLFYVNIPYGETGAYVWI